MIIVQRLKIYLELYLFRRKWRKLNRHNETIPLNFFRIDKVLVGKKTYGILDVYTHNNDSKLIIGNYCSIAKGVQFLLDAEHKLSTISAYPFKVKCFGYHEEAISKGDIVVEDDVWIGTNAIIRSGIRIGKGAIIAAGSVVVKDIEPYTIVGGNPAKNIRYRFDETIRKKLIEIDIVNLFDNLKQEDIDLLYTDINLNNFQEIIFKLQHK